MNEASTEISTEPTLQELLDQNARAFEARKNNRNYEVEYSAMIVTANSWRSRYEESGKFDSSPDTISRVHLVPRQREFELSEYPIGLTAMGESWHVPPVLKVEIIQANGERCPAQYEIFQYALEGELFGYRRKMIKCGVVQKEPLPKSTEQISGEEADKLLISYQQKFGTVFSDLEDPDEEFDSLGLFLGEKTNATISNVYLIVCGDAEKAGVQISVDEMSCEMKRFHSVANMPNELAYLCNADFPLNGWVSQQISTGQGARLRLENLSNGARF